MKRLIIFCFLIVFVLIAGGWHLYSEYIFKKNQELEIENFRRLVKATRSELPLDITSRFYDQIGPDQMLSVIEEDKYCHEKGHTVGRVIYQKTQDLNYSLAECSYRCTTGCFHGVLMELFGSNKADPHVRLEDIKSQIGTICDSKEITENKIQKGVCIHGVGHALMFLADYDTRLALDYCNNFEDPGSVYYCATGAFMERDRVSGVRDKSISEYYPCDQFDFPAACFRYKMPRVFKEDQLDEAKQYCLNIQDKQMQSGCFHGLGFRFFRMLDAGESLAAICNQGNSQDIKMCIEGAIGILSVFNKNRAVELCGQLGEPLESDCQKTAQQSNFGMEKDFGDYFIRN